MRSTNDIYVLLGQLTRTYPQRHQLSALGRNVPANGAQGYLHGHVATVVLQSLVDHLYRNKRHAHVGQDIEDVAAALRHVVLNPTKRRLEHLRLGVYTQQLRVQ